MTTRYLTSTFVTLSLKLYREEWEGKCIQLVKKLRAPQSVIRYETGDDGTHPHLHILIVGHSKVRRDKMRDRFVKVISQEDRAANPLWYHNARVPNPMDKLSYLSKPDKGSKYIYTDGVDWDKVPEYVPDINKKLLKKVFNPKSVILNRKTFCRFAIEFYRHYDLKYNLLLPPEFELFMLNMIQRGVNFDDLIGTKNFMDSSSYTYSTIFDKYSDHLVNLLEHMP